MAYQTITVTQADGVATIMAYAGICGLDNLQPHSDPYWVPKSYEEILSLVWARLPDSARLVVNAVTVENQTLVTRWHARHGGELRRRAAGLWKHRARAGSRIP